MAICSGSSKEWLFVHWIVDRIRIWKCWFLRRGENRSTIRKISRSREENQQQTQLNPHIALSPRTRATSVALTTMLYLLPMECVHMLDVSITQLSGFLFSGSRFIATCLIKFKTLTNCILYIFARVLSFATKPHVCKSIFQSVRILTYFA